MKLPRKLMLSCLLFFVLGQVWTGQIVAQEVIIDPQPITPEVPTTYQPPVNADDFSDFLPEGAVTVTLPMTPTTPITETVVPESGLAVGESEGKPGDSKTENNSNLVENEPEEPSSASVSLTDHQTVGVLVADGLLGVVAEEETFGEAVTLEIQGIQALENSAITPTITFENLPEGTPIQPESSSLVAFQLEAYSEQTGAEIAEFNKPVRLVLDLRELGYEGNNQNFFLAYQDESDPNLWHSVPVVVHQETGLISAEVPHFSSWVTGWRPGAWAPSWTPPSVSEFSGAATYSYPLDIPPGRGGLQPSLALTYSSRSIDGAIRSVSKGNVASGWSVGDSYIIRDGGGLESMTVGGTPTVGLKHPDRFRLVLNGTGYELIRDDNTASTANVTRYYAKDAPGLKIMRYYNTAAPNAEKLYWIVQSSEGVHYRFGYQADAEAWQRMEYNASAYNFEGHGGLLGGDADRTSAVSWHLDTVTDLYGNQMVLKYNTASGFLYACDRADLCNGEGKYTNRVVRLASISYNFPSQAAIVTNGDGTVTVPQDIAQLTQSTAGTRLEFHGRAAGDLVGPIQNIFVFHGGSTLTGNPMKEYRFEVQTASYIAAACPDRDNNPTTTFTDAVTAITTHVNVDRDPTTITAGHTLPPINFTYTPKSHFTQNGQPCFGYSYLESYTNGYGGKVVFTYQSDNRSNGTYVRESYFNITWPDIGFSYVVSEVKATDNQFLASPKWQKTTYSYSSPCYNQTQTTVPACASVNASAHGGLAGYGTTTVISYDFDQVTPLTKQVSKFYQNVLYNGQYVDYQMGRPYEVKSYGYNSGTSTYFHLSTSSTYYNTVKFGFNGTVWDDDAPFTYVSETHNAQYYNNNTALVLSSKTRYSYDTAGQHNQQFGLVTKIEQFDSTNPAIAPTPYQTVGKTYRSNTSGDIWLIRQVTEGVYDQNNVLKRGSWLYYDQAIAANMSTTATLKRGQLSRSSQFVPSTNLNGCTPSCNAYQTIDSYQTYDLFGNVTTSKNFTGYGHRVFDAGWGIHTDSLPSSTTEQTTTIAFDATYKLYPVSVTNALGQTTSFGVYGFGQSLSGFQTQKGLLRHVTEINSHQTLFEYDPFGRLFATYEGTETTGFGNSTPADGDPINRYEYYDNNWQGSELPASGSNATRYFPIVTYTRPGTYSATSTYQFKQVSYHDGFGRVIQTQNHTASVGDVLANDKRIIVSQTYSEMGQVECQTVPYAVAQASGYVNESCDSKSEKSITVYYPHLPGRVTSYAPDGTATQQYTAIDDKLPNGTGTQLITGTGQYYHLTSTVDPMGYAKTQVTNSKGQLVRVVEYTGTSTYTIYGELSYSYDWAGNLTQTQDEAGNLTTLTYDNFGRKTYMKDPDMGVWRYAYDALGNMTSQDDLILDMYQAEQLQNRTCLYYDVLNRLVAKNIVNSCPTTPATSGSTWVADYIYYTSATGTTGETGKLAEVRWNRGNGANNTDKELFDYDSFGRLTRHERQLEGLSFVMQYGTFDRLNRPTVVTYPDGTVANVGYDHEGEDVLTISNSGLASNQNLVTDVMFNQRGQLHKIDRSTNMDTFYDYYGAAGTAGTGNSNFRLSGLRHGGVAGDSFPDFGYTYDQRGNILTLAESGQNTLSYTYDHLSRLTQYTVLGGTGSEAYAYNAIGNMTTFKGVTVNYTGLQPHAATSRSGNYYGYDDNGNMTSRTEGGTSYTQNFDKENRLTSVVVNGQTTTFRYDPSGQRTLTIEPGGAKTYFPFPTYEYEVNGATTKQRSTYSLAGQAIAIRERENSNAPTFYYLYSDHLGSTSMMAYTMGGVLAGSTARYTPFGEYVGGVAPSQTVTDRGFTGHQHNNSLKLIYMNARFYVPGVGRFASADTIIPNAGNPQSYNRYSYVKNNPLNRVDPTGHVDCSLLGDGGDSAGCEEAKSKTKPEEQIASTSRTLAEWELHALMQAVYSETVNGSYSPELLEFLAWGYLNRLSSGKWANMGDAVYSEAPIGYTPDGIPIFPGSPQSSAGVLWAEVRDKWTKKDVPQLVEERWAINANSNWQTVEEIVNLVYQDWLQNGAGSANDPTNGSYFYAAFSELNENNDGISLTEFESLVADKANSFQSLQNEDPNFRWGKTSVYSTSRSYIVFFAANSHCGYNLNCGE